MPAAGSAPPLSPLAQLLDSLYGNSEQGAVFIPQPTLLGDQNLWQMSDGTAIVDSDGDPVGRNDDVSGNGNHATQPVSADRPLYRTDGSRDWNEFDATDVHLELPEIFGDEDNWVFAIAVRPLVATDANPRYFSMVRAGMNLQCGYINDGTVFTRVSGTTYNTNQKVTLGQPMVIQHIRQDGVSYIRINGQDLGFSTGTTPSADSQMGPSLGAGHKPTNFKLAGDIYGALYRHGAYSQEMAIEVDKHLATLAGVTL